MDPASVTFAGATIEPLDGCPRVVEENLDACQPRDGAVAGCRRLDSAIRTRSVQAVALT